MSYARFSTIMVKPHRAEDRRLEERLRELVDEERRSVREPIHATTGSGDIPTRCTTTAARILRDASCGTSCSMKEFWSAGYSKNGGRRCISGTRGSGLPSSAAWTCRSPYDDRVAAGAADFSPFDAQSRATPESRVICSLSAGRWREDAEQVNARCA